MRGVSVVSGTVGGHDSDVDIFHIELLNKGIFEQQPFFEKQLYA
jgi:hypothetical protein